MGDVITVQVTGDRSLAGEDGRIAWKGRLFSWDFTPKTPHGESPEEVHNVRVYKGPSRVLEMGCGDGEWCLKVKADYPDWIVEGLDDVDHWSKKHPEMKFRYIICAVKTVVTFTNIALCRDFMESDDVMETTDYFSRVHLTQENVEFTVRSLSSLTSHFNPVPEHIYSFIRARDIFDRVETYKGFLEDIHR
jgi:hypothetical protein